MTTDIQPADPAQIRDFIYTVRGVQVMLDSDLAKLYGVETKRLNETVKRNINRFPDEFRFQVTKKEIEILVSHTDRPVYDSLRSQFATSKKGRGGRRTLPYAFTEQGVAMLSAVLRSETAVNVSVQIMNAFVAMRRFIGAYHTLFERVDQVELKQLKDKSEIDEKFERVFDAIEGREISPKQGLVYDGQVFDAHAFVSKIIRSAKKSITIVDNYIDTTVLTLLTNRRKGVKVRLCTKSISKRLTLGVRKFNEQYGQLEVEERNDIHDRFIIVDDKTIYHTGASLKDLGKKVSAFSRFDKEGLKLLERIN